MVNHEEKWKTIRKKVLYDGFLTLYEDIVKLPNNEETTYVVNRSGDAAAVLIVSEKDDVILTYQYRYPINEWIYDLPGGKVRRGESPEDAAIRECIEETGYKPIGLKKILEYHPSPSRSDGVMHIFFSNKVEQKTKPVENSIENVRVRIVKREIFEKMLKLNNIKDPALLIGWHSAKLHGFL